MRQATSDKESPEELSAAREERRRKREERREKQRTANVGRAEKMHKLRIEREQAGGPPIIHALASTEKAGASRYHIGCSGWFYWRWRGDFYPEALPTSAWFPHYASRFETVEINASFA